MEVIWDVKKEGSNTEDRTNGTVRTCKVNATNNINRFECSCVDNLNNVYGKEKDGKGRRLDRLPDLFSYINIKIETGVDDGSSASVEGRPLVTV